MARRREPDERQAREQGPTAEFVQGLYRLRINEGDEARLRHLAAQFRTLVRLEHKVDIPEQYRATTKEIRTPFIRDTWQRVTAALVHDPPSPHVEPKDEKQDSKRASSIAERWTVAAMQALDDELGENVVRAAVRALVRDGESVIKVVHRPHAWANFPKRQRGEEAETFQERVERWKKRHDTRLPFAWRVVDRLSMLFGDGEYGDDWALEYGEYPVQYLAHRYRMAVDPRDGRLVQPTDLGGRPKPEGLLDTAGARATKIEYWDADWWAVVIDGTMAPGFPRPNPYAPMLPYFRAKAVDSEPILYSLLFLVPGLDSLLTMKMNWAYLSAYPNPKITRAPTAQGLDLPLGEEPESEAIQWKPGKVIDLSQSPGLDLSFLVPPPVGQDLDEMVIVLRQLIDIAGVPSVFRGIGGADQAGYAINQLVAAATLTYKELADEARRQLSKAIGFIWTLVERHVGQTVYVLGTLDDERKWLGLKPTGAVTESVAPVDQLGPLQMAFHPILPTDEQARSMIALQLTNARKQLVSKRTALEKYLQIEDPELELDRIAVENALDEEPLRSIWLQQALQDAGLLPNPNNPANALVGPTGEPLVPSPFPPGQMGAGLPAIPGLTQPLQPEPSETPAIVPGDTGGRPAGAFPGRPGGVPRGRRSMSLRTGGT